MTQSFSFSQENSIKFSKKASYHHLNNNYNFLPPNSCVKLLLHQELFSMLLLKLTLCSPWRHWELSAFRNRIFQLERTFQEYSVQIFHLQGRKISPGSRANQRQKQSSQGQELILDFQCLSSRMPGTQQIFNRYLLDKQMTQEELKMLSLSSLSSLSTALWPSHKTSLAVIHSVGNRDVRPHAWRWASPWLSYLLPAVDTGMKLQ